MIIKCKICNGSGTITTTQYFNKIKKVCPACHGAGEFELNAPPENTSTCKICKGIGTIKSKDVYTTVNKICPTCKGLGLVVLEMPIDSMSTCKVCNGLGIVKTQDAFTTVNKICPACKGIGLVERTNIDTNKSGSVKSAISRSNRLATYNFDVAISYASEDLNVVNEYMRLLCLKGLEVYFDKSDEVGLWGTNLYDKFDEIFRTKALFCVIFISNSYANKVWTNHERRSAQARALQENREYVLPVKLDDTEIPGIPPTIGYVDLRRHTIEYLANMTLEKVRRLKSQ
jgi:hypothetical protein